MRTIARSVFAVALAFSFNATAHAQDASNAEELRSSYEAAFNAGDASQLAGLFAEGAVIMPPNADMVEGRPGIEQHYGAVFQQGASSGLSVESREMRPLGDGFVDMGTYSLSATGPDGQSATVSGDYMAVIERGDGDQWMITRHIWNEDQPGSTQ